MKECNFRVKDNIMKDHCLLKTGFKSECDGEENCVLCRGMKKA